jgi:ABC-type bacteriocin/lantibiotic exporter with double-glycine peptidase domain
MLLRFHGRAADLGALRHRFAPEGDPMDEVRLLRAAKQLELKSKLVTTT